MKYIFIIMVVLFSGCAAKGALYKDVQTNTLNGKSSITVFRKKQFTDGGSCYTVYVDEKSVGVLANGGFIEILLEPGKHIVTIPHINGKKLSSEAVLEKNEKYYVEYNSLVTGVNVIPIGTFVTTNVSFNFALSPVSENYALGLLKDLRDSSQKVSCMATVK
jgi:hypothetical protein